MPLPEYRSTVMTRRRLFIVQVALLGALGALAFPGESSALVGGGYVALTSTGPSPSTVTMPVVHGQLDFDNTDTVAHSIAFTNLSCSGEVAPNSHLICTIPGQIGDYGYTVDGTTQASVNIVPESRAVTLRAKRHGVRLGAKMRLHGRLTAVVAGAPPSSYGPRMPVTVFGRPVGGHVWHRIAVVMAKPLKKAHFGSAYSVWHIWVRPRAGTTYRVEAKSQPKGGQFWQNAQSKPFRVAVRHRR